MRLLIREGKLSPGFLQWAAPGSLQLPLCCWSGMEFLFSFSATLGSCRVLPGSCRVPPKTRLLSPPSKVIFICHLGVAALTLSKNLGMENIKSGQKDYCNINVKHTLDIFLTPLVCP